MRCSGLLAVGPLLQTSPACPELRREAPQPATDMCVWRSSGESLLLFVDVNSL